MQLTDLARLSLSTSPGTNLISNNDIQKISLDGLFVSTIQSFAKVFISKYSTSMLKIENMTNAKINEYSKNLCDKDPVIVLRAIGDLAREIKVATTGTNLHPVYKSEMLGLEVIFSYDEAAQFTQFTRTTFGINIDTTYTDFTYAGAGTIYGSSSAKRGDGTEKLSGATSWSGVDMVVVALLGDYVRVLPDFGTISFSVHREKVNAHALGSVNRKGHTNGPRTIAGSMIGVALRDEPLKGLQPSVIEDLSGLDQMGQSATPYREYMLPDQLPDFDVIISIQNEMGHMAKIAMFGVTISDVGQTVSINDNQTEIVYTYTATDMDLLSYEGTSRKGGASFSLSLQAYKERRDRIDGGRTTHNSPYEAAEFWDVWSPEKRIMLEPQDLAVRSEAPRFNTDPDPNLKPYVSKTNVRGGATVKADKIALVDLKPSSITEISNA